MPRIAHVRAGLAWGILFTVALPAQERKVLVGRVLDAAAPVAGATVTLAWSPPGGEDCGPADVVKAVTDERGRFVARVFAQQGYSIWATHAAEGRVRASGVINGTGAGSDVELRLDRDVSPCGVCLEGASAYAAIGPLRLQGAPRAANLAWFDLASGEAPTLPSIGLLVVRDSQGDVLCARSVQGGRPDGITFHLPPAATLQVRVLDCNRKPVAGATVRHAAGSLSTMLAAETLFEPPSVEAWRRCGTSGADGLAPVLVPWPAGQTALPLLVRAAGLAETCVVVTPAFLGGILEAVLLPAARLRVTSGGAPLAAAQARLTASYRGNPSFERVTALQLGADCELPIPVEPIEAMLHVRTGPAEPWHLQRIPFHAGVLTATDLGDDRLLSLQFLDGNGGPARGLAGVLMAVGSRFANAQQVPVCTDQGGRIERLVGPDAWLLFVTDGVQWASHRVPRADEPSDAGAFRATLHCEALPLAKVHVVDAANRPLPGAVLSDAMRTVDRPQPAAPDRATELLDQLMQTLGPRLVNGAHSDDQGLVVVRTPPRDAYMLSVLLSAPGHGGARVKLAPDSEQVAPLPSGPLPRGH